MPGSYPAMEFRKVPLLKGVSQRGKILFAAAKTNCSDSPVLPAQGVTGPDGPAGPGYCKQQPELWGTELDEQEKHRAVQELLPEPLLCTNPRMRLDKHGQP